jgi:fumarate hydratase subunit alpha
MREISCEQITQLVRDLCIEANCNLTDDLRQAICAGCEAEQSPVGKSIFGDLIENYTFADQHRLPICQDTGMAVVFCDVGQEVHITGGLLTDAVNQGVARGYTEGFLRKSVVSDPLRRVNTNDNTPAVLHTRLVAGDQITITVAPKGFGSENMSAMKMFKPSVSQEDVEDFIVQVCAEAGANPCPPMVVGVGLGGDFELAAENAKRSLLLPVDGNHEDPYYADMERRVLEKINRLGIGPQGLGGTVTALAVRITPYPTHIAGLPCGVNISCHVTRHAKGVL